MKASAVKFSHSDCRRLRPARLVTSTTKLPRNENSSARRSRRHEAARRWSNVSESSRIIHPRRTADTEPASESSIRITECSHATETSKTRTLQARLTPPHLGNLRKNAHARCVTCTDCERLAAPADARPYDRFVIHRLLLLRDLPTWAPKQARQAPSWSAAAACSVTRKCATFGGCRLPGSWRRQHVRGERR